MSDHSPAEFFDFTTFGAVELLAESTKVAITLTDAERTQLDRAASWFRANKSDAVLSLPFPTETDAKEFRAKVRAFADSRQDISATFPKRSEDRWQVTLTLTAKDAPTVENTVAEIKKLIGSRPAKVRGNDDHRTVTLATTREGLAKDLFAQATKLYSGRPVRVGSVEFVKGNGYSAKWNTGTNVTFRLPEARKASQNGEVTVSTVPVTV